MEILSKFYDKDLQEQLYLSQVDFLTHDQNSPDLILTVMAGHCPPVPVSARQCQPSVTSLTYRLHLPDLTQLSTLAPHAFNKVFPWRRPLQTRSQLTFGHATLQQGTKCAAMQFPSGAVCSQASRDPRGKKIGCNYQLQETTIIGGLHRFPLEPAGPLDALTQP